MGIDETEYEFKWETRWKKSKQYKNPLKINQIDWQFFDFYFSGVFGKYVVEEDQQQQKF